MPVDNPAILEGPDAKPRIAAAVKKTFPEVVAAGGKYELSDDGNAEAFADAYRNEVRYDHARQHWLVWRDHRWHVDTTGRVYAMAARLNKARWNAAFQIADPSAAKKHATWLLRSNDAKRLDNCLKLAATKGLGTEGSEWDRNPLLIGVANGVVDLSDGRLRPGHPDDMLTKALPVEFDPNAPCPRWEQFLTEVFQGDQEMIDFVQRAIGYSLTANTDEEALFFCYGLGRNGKSVCLNTLKQLFGRDYAWSLPFESLSRKRGESVPTDITDLDGRRFIVTSESRKGAAFDEQRVKGIVSRDDITARRMRKDFYSFSPTHKIWLMANHRPEVEDATEGFWRRLKLIPFKAQFQGRAQDRQLERKLRAELPGILRWAVKGCLKWQKEGLTPPATVEKATAAYRENANGFEPFVQQQLVFFNDAKTTSSELQAAYTSWRRSTPDAPARS